MTDTDLEQRLRDLRQRDLEADTPPSRRGRPVDTASAWREFQALRSRSVTTRRRALAVAAAAAVAGLVIAVPALNGAKRGGQPVQPTTSTSIPASPRTYQKAIAARIPMSGVTAVVGDAGHAWVIRAVEQPGLATTYQLAGIDLRTNSVMFRAGLGRQLPSIAAGQGRLWLTTPYGEPRGQVVRVDLATGQVLSSIHLPARACSQVAFAAGNLFAACGAIGSPGTQFWRIDPATERGQVLAGPVHGHVFSLTATPDAAWYTRVPDVIGLVGMSGPSHLVHFPNPPYQQTPGTQEPVYGDGSVWVLSDGERLTRLDPATGHVLRRYTYRAYDPARAGGLDYMTAGGGWLWFLDNGYPFSGVLRVSERTGRPAGGVRIAPNSCGQQVCSQIFYTPGAVWVPTAEYLIRIDTSRLAR